MLVYLPKEWQREKKKKAQAANQSFRIYLQGDYAGITLRSLWMKQLMDEK